VFRIRKEPDGAVTDERRIAAIRGRSGSRPGRRTTVEALLARRPRAPSIVDRAKPEVPATEVRVDNEISPIFTVLDIFTEDKPACSTPSREPCRSTAWTSHRSRVGVAGDRVADIFYVRDIATGGKLTDPARLNALADALKQALRRLRGARGSSACRKFVLVGAARVDGGRWPEPDPDPQPDPATGYRSLDTGPCWR